MSNKHLQLEMVAKTAVGRVRTINEDNFIATPSYKNTDWHVPKDGYANEGTVMVVADGMGGAQAGEVASHIVVNSIKKYIGKQEYLPVNEADIRIMLERAILFAHKSVIEHGKKNVETQGMGSTIIVGIIIEGIVHIAWSGDSRCYVFTNGKLKQLTKDHSYVQTLVDEGKITAEQAFLHPDSNIIMQSLGDTDHDPHPDYTSYLLHTNDILLFCSDGLHSMLNHSVIQNIIGANQSNLTQCAERLIDTANTEGGLDNITVLLNKIISNGASLTKTSSVLQQAPQ